MKELLDPFTANVVGTVSMIATVESSISIFEDSGGLFDGIKDEVDIIRAACNRIREIVKSELNKKALN